MPPSGDAQPCVRSYRPQVNETQSGPARYEIRVAAVLDGRWAAWFNGLQVSAQGEETLTPAQVMPVRASVASPVRTRAVP